MLGPVHALGKRRLPLIRFIFGDDCFSSLPMQDAQPRPP
jgi:hypothetical protein